MVHRFGWFLLNLMTAPYITVHRAHVGTGPFPPVIETGARL
jgi:hypothetical protein